MGAGTGDGTNHPRHQTLAVLHQARGLVIGDSTEPVSHQPAPCIRRFWAGTGVGVDGDLMMPALRHNLTIERARRGGRKSGPLHPRTAYTRQQCSYPAGGHPGSRARADRDRSKAASDSPSRYIELSSCAATRRSRQEASQTPLNG